MRRRASRNSTITSCIGIDDGPFLSRRLGGSRAPLVAVLLKGPHLVKARTAWIGVDGFDATGVASSMLSSLRARESPILLAGATFGGFNVINPRMLLRKFRTPTIIVIGSRPDNRAVKRAWLGIFLTGGEDGASYPPWVHYVRPKRFRTRVRSSTKRSAVATMKREGS